MSSAMVSVLICTLSFFVFAVFLVGFMVFHNKKMISTHKKIQTLEREKNRKMILNVLEIQERERARIGANIHDDLGPNSSAIKMKILNLASNDLEKKEDYELLTEMIEENIKNIRSISQSLYPVTIEKFGVIVAIEEFIRRIRKVTNIEVDLSLDEQLLNYKKSTQMNIYRIIQEFCNNSIKHSQCKRLSIDVSELNGKMVVTLSDDGVGFREDKVQVKSLGMNNLRMRAEIEGFDFNFISKLNNGTKLILTQI